LYWYAINFAPFLYGHYAKPDGRFSKVEWIRLAIWNLIRHSVHGLVGMRRFVILAMDWPESSDRDVYYTAPQ
jgi:hypothetical protein